MSRVGKYPVSVPSGVAVAIKDGVFSAKGKLGESALPILDEIEAGIDGDTVWVKPRQESKRARALWGTTRANIANLVKGVSEGFSKRLEMVGVGYKAQIQGSNLVLSLGYSHDVVFPIPADVKIVCESPTAITISGVLKQRVGQIAAEIRGFRPPEPYKGKGVKYAGEWILRKEGKKR